MSVAEAPTEAQPEVEEVVPAKPKRVRKPRPPKVVAETPPPAEEPAPEPPPTGPTPEPDVEREPLHSPAADSQREPAKPKRVRAPRKPKAPKNQGDPNELVPTVDAGDPIALLSRLPVTPVGDLSTDQRHARYDYLKRVVSVSLGSFVLIGRALDEIRENEYWKLDRYPSWDEFCQTEWDLNGKSRASQLILASRTFSELKDYLEAKGVQIPLPSIESHLVPLQKLDSVEERANAWQAAYATAERKTGDRLRLTADHINKVVQEHLGFKQLPDTGPNTNKPTPPEKPPAKEEIPPHPGAARGHRPARGRRAPGGAGARPPGRLRPQPGGGRDRQHRGQAQDPDPHGRPPVPDQGAQGGLPQPPRPARPHPGRGRPGEAGGLAGQRGRRGRDRLR